MNSDITRMIAIPSMFAWIAWAILSTIRRYKIAKLQAEVQTKLLDKVGSGQDLLAYAQTEVGKELLQSLRVERISPYGRILGALQAGIVLVLFGIALLMFHNRDQGFLLVGALTTALGFGFVLSAVASYYLSKSFGLLNGAPNHGR